MKTKIKYFDQSYYENLVRKSKSSAAEKILLIISFLESIIFPIPVDPLLAFLIFYNPNKLIKLTFFLYLGISSWRISGVVIWIFFRK